MIKPARLLKARLRSAFSESRMRKWKALCADHAGSIRYYGILIAVLALLGTAAYRYRDVRATPPSEHEHQGGQSVSIQITPKPTETPKLLPLLPSGQILNAFSADALAWSETLNQWQTHPATDFACSDGEAVLAVADGIVREKAYDPLYGNTIVIDHGNGAIARYASLNTLELVEVGQSVARGDVISAAGTCLAEEKLGVHVHIAYYLNSVPTDITSEK